MASPRPRPARPAAAPLTARWGSSKMVACCSAGTPRPVSVTATVTVGLPSGACPADASSRMHALVGELDRIADEVEHHLLQPGRIAHDPWTTLRKVGLEGQVAALGESVDRSTAARPRTSERSSGSSARRSCPAWLLARSSTSSIKRPRCAALVAMRSRSWWRAGASSGPSAASRRMRSDRPTTTPSGVRSSWLTMDRKRLRCALASSARRRAARASW